MVIVLLASYPLLKPAPIRYPITAKRAENKVASPNVACFHNMHKELSEINKKVT